MKSILGFVAVAAVSRATFNCVGGELVILQPTGEESVWLMSKRKMDYLSLPLAERVKWVNVAMTAYGGLAKPRGKELESGAGKTHKVEVFAWPADGEKKLSRVQLLGRGGKVLAEKRDFAGGCITWNVAADAEGGYLVARVFGENDADFAEKRQQIVKHCALTNPVWLRTDAFRAPKPIAAPDPLTIREVRELEDFLLKGEFRFDPRVKKELEPGMVPVWAFQIDKVRAALERAAAR